MKIPLLILCLVVVYGSCRTYDKENVDVVKEIQKDYNEDYKVNIANVPFERFLARHKRASLLSPITNPIDMTLHLLDNSLISTIINFIKSTFGALTERNLCPKVEKLSIELIPKLHPMETIRTIVCYIFQVMGTQGQTLMTKAFEIFGQFFRNVFLPGLHTTLNVLKNTGLLPREINALIDMFNVIYKMMQITGYIH